MKLNKKNDKNHEESTIKKELEKEISNHLQFDTVVEDFLIQTRRLLLIGEIDEMASTYICSYLQILSLKKQPIYLYINSPGGCLSSGYAIIDQMLACNCPVYTIVRGQAHSMGAIIAAFGQKGHRYSTPNSSMMLHSIIVQSPSDSIENHTNMIDYVKHDYNRKMRNLAKRLKLTTKQLIKTMNDILWMSPEHAIKIGLIDHIWTPHMERTINKELCNDEEKAPYYSNIL